MGFLTIVIYIILSIAGGLFFLGLSLGILTIDAIANYLSRIPADFRLNAVTFLVGILLILICIRYLQTIFLSSRRNRSITFESDDGKVSVTLVAIEDMLKRMLEEKTEVSRIRPKVILRKKSIEVIARGVLTTEVNLVEFTKELQEQIREKIHTLLGQDKQVQVNLEIRKIALTGKELQEEKEPEIPFRNY